MRPTSRFQKKVSVAAAFGESKIKSERPTWSRLQTGRFYCVAQLSGNRVSSAATTAAKVSNGVDSVEEVAAGARRGSRLPPGERRCDPA